MGLAANTGQPVIVSRAENQVAETLVRIKIIKGNPLLIFLHYLLQNADTLSILPIFENQVVTALDDRLAIEVPRNLDSNCLLLADPL